MRRERNGECDIQRLAGQGLNHSLAFEELPFGGRWAELVEGIPIVFEPPDPVHGNVILNVSKTLADYIQRTGIGYACFDLGLLLARDPDTLRYPAVSYFVDGPRFAESDKLFTEVTPAFVIEVASSVDRRQLMRRSFVPGEEDERVG